MVIEWDQELEGSNVEGVLVLNRPWPSIARTIYRDHSKYLETYMKVSIYPFLAVPDQYIFCSRTRVHSTLETAVPATNTDTSGLRAVWMVYFPHPLAL
jgi:hypothetical protein